MSPRGPKKERDGAHDEAKEGFAALVPDAKPILPGRARRPVAARREAAAPKATNAPVFRWPDAEQRRLAGAPGISDELLARLRRGEPEPEERIDLHGTRVADAKRLATQRIVSAQARGVRCVLLVHGRGRGSAMQDAPLRDGVPDWLTRGAAARHVLAFAPAPGWLGGEGATIVLLRKAATG